LSHKDKGSTLPEENKNSTQTSLPEADRPAKFLVLQLKRIGDLILTTPALAALRKHFPQARITLCTADACSALAAAMPFVDEFLVFRRRRGDAALWAHLAVEHFDVCLDFTGNDRSAFFAFLSKARRRIAFGSVRKTAFRPLAYHEFVNCGARRNHTVDRHLALLEPLGIAEPDSPVTLCLPPDAFEAAGRCLEEAGIAGPYALVHPGTARPEKYWLPERWAAVIDHCQSQLGLPCLLTGSVAPAERAHLDAIRAALKTPCREAVGKTDLLILAALIARARILLSMDSAPVHLGAAFGTPQISLFGETNPFQWRPRHSKSAILTPGIDEPLRDFTPFFTARPLKDLSTAPVIAAIESLLAIHGTIPI